MLDHTTLSDQLDAWRYAYGERIAICVVNGATQAEAEAIAAQQIGAEAVARFRLDMPPNFENAATVPVFESANDVSDFNPVSRSQNLREAA